LTVEDAAALSVRRFAEDHHQANLFCVLFRS
jgi:hypothetical protein